MFYMKKIIEVIHLNKNGKQIDINSKEVYERIRKAVFSLMNDKIQHHI